MTPRRLCVACQCQLEIIVRFRPSWKCAKFASLGTPYLPINYHQAVMIWRKKQGLRVWQQKRARVSKMLLRWMAVSSRCAHAKRKDVYIPCDKTSGRLQVPYCNSSGEVWGWRKRIGCSRRKNGIYTTNQSNRLVVPGAGVKQIGAWVMQIEWWGMSDWSRFFGPSQKTPRPHEIVAKPLSEISCFTPGSRLPSFVPSPHVQKLQARRRRCQAVYHTLLPFFIWWEQKSSHSFLDLCFFPPNTHSLNSFIHSFKRP